MTGPGMTLEEDVCGTERIAKLAGVSQRTARRWLASGVLPVLPGPPGSPYRVSLAELRKRLARRRGKGSE